MGLPRFLKEALGIDEPNEAKLHALPSCIWHENLAEPLDLDGGGGGARVAASHRPLQHEQQRPVRRG